MHTRKITKPLKPRHFTEMFITYLNTQDVQGTRRQQHCREEKMQSLNCVEHRNFKSVAAPGRLPPPRRRRSRTARASTPPDRCGRHEFFSENSAPNLDHFRCTFWQIQGQWSRTQSRRRLQGPRAGPLAAGGPRPGPPGPRIRTWTQVKFPGPECGACRRESGHTLRILAGSMLGFHEPEPRRSRTSQAAS